MLDMKTVLLSSVISNALVAVFMALLWYRNRKRYAGLSFWLANYILQMVGILLQALRNVAPDYISIVLSNTMIVGGALFVLMGLERFVGRTRSQIHNYIALAVVAASLTYFTNVAPNIDIRTIIVHAALAFMTLQCAWLMLRRTGSSLLPVTRSVGVVFIIYSTVTLARVLHLSIVPIPADISLFDMPAAQVFYMLALQMLNIALTFILILMVTRRLSHDVQTHEQKYASLYNSMQEGMALHEIIYDEKNRPVDYRILDVNPAYEAVLGLKRGQVVGKTASDVYSAYGVRYLETYAKVAETRQPALFEAYIPSVDRYFRVSAFSPEPGRSASIFEDITERKRAGEALRDSEEKFRGVFETSRDFTFISTLDGKILDNNESVRDFFGYSQKEIRAMNIRDFYAHPEEQERFRQVAIKKGYVENYELKLKKKDGTIFDTQVTVVARKDVNGNVVGFQGSVRDVTEKRKMEQQLLQSEKLSTIGTMISGVAHELNNPLTSIIGNTQLLMRKDLPEDIRTKLNVIFRESQRSAGIVSGLLAFAREHKPERKPSNVNDIIVDSVRLRDYDMKVNNIDVQLSPDPDLPEILCDPFQLQQVFINLINNAYDALTQKGGGALAISTSRREDNVVIECKDDGPGIHKDLIKRIFDPFFTTKDVGKGTGLGLSMAYGIVKEHGGTISVESRLGKGSKFTITLPIVPMEQETGQAEAHENEHSTRKHGARGGKSILLVDDDDILGPVISEALSSEGYRVDRSNGGPSAIELLERNRYDCIISDTKRRGKTGEKLYRYITEHYPQMGGKVLVVTGGAPGRNVQAFLRVAGNRYIEKPFDIDALLKIVDEIIS